jgi:hypothetical protein
MPRGRGAGRRGRGAVGTSRQSSASRARPCRRPPRGAFARTSRARARPPCGGCGLRVPTRRCGRVPKRIAAGAAALTPSAAAGVPFLNKPPFSQPKFPAPRLVHSVIAVKQVHNPVDSARLREGRGRDWGGALARCAARGRACICVQRARTRAAGATRARAARPGARAAAAHDVPAGKVLVGRLAQAVGRAEARRNGCPRGCCQATATAHVVAHDDDHRGACCSGARAGQGHG